MRTERERSKTEMKDLQLQLSEMHDELDRAKKAEVINTEKEVLLKVNESHEPDAPRKSAAADVCWVSIRIWYSCVGTSRRCYR